MHYQINDIIVKSELAAKPLSQTNKYVLKYISLLSNEYEVLDYGCGKLRYSIPISKKVKEIVAIDSKEQVDSYKKIGDRYCRPRDCSKDNLMVMSIDEMDWSEKRFDVVFCTNVLSAIPFEKERIKLLENAKKVMNNTGVLFISVQYRNSYFKGYNYRNDVSKYNDGWLIKTKSRNQVAFYAELPADYIIELCKRAGFSSFKVKKKDGSCFIEAKNI